jgi:hypothetical protein
VFPVRYGLNLHMLFNELQASKGQHVILVLVLSAGYIFHCQLNI